MSEIDRPRDLLGRGPKQALGNLALLAAVLLHLGVVANTVGNVAQFDVP